jgi:tripartite motif-containing protein 71
VYVVDGQEWRVLKFTNTGKLIKTWGTLGWGEGQFNFPSDVAVDPSGYVFVTDYWNHRIQKFTNNGTFIREWGERE